MGRLKSELLERTEAFSHRVYDVVETIEKQGRSRRVVEQMAGSGTSVGANTWEADEALSRADFAKSIGVSLKELGETRFWLRFVAKRGWVKPARLDPLQDEARELRLVLGSIYHRTRKNGAAGGGNTREARRAS